MELNDGYENNKTTILNKVQKKTPTHEAGVYI